MSFELAGVAWRVKIDGRFRLLLLALADFADDDGDGIWPSIATLAEKIDYSERQVQRMLRDLEEMKVLKPTGKSVGQSTVYRLDLTGLPLKERKRRHHNERRPDPRQNVTRQKITGDIHDKLPVTLATRNGEVTGDTMSPNPVPKVTEPSDELLAGASSPVVPPVAVPESSLEAPPEVPPETSSEISPHKLLTSSWCAEFEKKFERKYFFQAADGVAASRILSAGFQPLDILAVARKAWESLPAGFLRDQSARLSSFVARFNEIQITVQSVAPKTQRPAWMDVRDLENERKPLAAELDEWNAILQHDANRTQENIDKRKAVRERVQAIDARIAELKPA
jgi:DNA-binding Lrp family transcriptional regulator